MDGIASRARLMGNYGAFLTEKGIEEGGFSCVWSS